MTVSIILAKDTEGLLQQSRSHGTFPIILKEKICTSDFFYSSRKFDELVCPIVSKPDNCVVSDCLLDLHRHKDVFTHRS